MLISIIVMLGNHAAYWNSILYDLLCQDYGAQQMELLFVCTSAKQKQFLNNSKDLEAFHRTHILDGDNWLPALKKAAGSYITRVDDSIHIPSNWISSHVICMQEQIICGGRFKINSQSKTPWFAMEKYDTYKALQQPSKTNVSNTFLPYAMYHRNVCDAVRFNDTEFGYQQYCINQGYRLRYLPFIYAQMRCQSGGAIIQELCKLHYKLGLSMIYRTSDIGLWILLGCLSIMSLHSIVFYAFLGIVFAFPCYLVSKQFPKEKLPFLPIIIFFFYLGWCRGVWQQLFAKKRNQKQLVAIQTYQSKKIPNI